MLPPKPLDEIQSNLVCELLTRKGGAIAHFYLAPRTGEGKKAKYHYILKAKSNFTLLLYIHFLGIGEWYFKCVKFILNFNQLFI